MPARFKDSPGLFGIGCGHGTYGNVVCEWCGANHNDRENSEGDTLSDVSVLVDNFGDKQILGCCFGDVESAVIRNMGRIIPWYIEILKARQNKLAKQFGELAELKELLNTHLK